MPINADKPHVWKADTRALVDQFNREFVKFAPKAYRDTRKKTVESVDQERRPPILMHQERAHGV